MISDNPVIQAMMRRAKATKTMEAFIASTNVADRQGLRANEYRALRSEHHNAQKAFESALKAAEDEANAHVMLGVE